MVLCQILSILKCLLIMILCQVTSKMLMNQMKKFNDSGTISTPLQKIALWCMFKALQTLNEREKKNRKWNRKKVKETYRNMLVLPSTITQPWYNLMGWLTVTALIMHMASSDWGTNVAMPSFKLMTQWRASIPEALFSTMDRILCFLISLNPLRFTLTRLRLNWHKDN